MFPHFANKFGYSLPILFATRIVELLGVMRRLRWVGLEMCKQDGSAMLDKAIDPGGVEQNMPQTRKLSAAYHVFRAARKLAL